MFVSDTNFQTQLEEETQQTIALHRFYTSFVCMFVCCLSFALYARRIERTYYMLSEKHSRSSSSYESRAPQAPFISDWVLLCSSGDKLVQCTTEFPDMARFLARLAVHNISEHTN